MEITAQSEKICLIITETVYFSQLCLRVCGEMVWITGVSLAVSVNLQAVDQTSGNRSDCIRASAVCILKG